MSNNPKIFIKICAHFLSKSPSKINECIQLLIFSAVRGTKDNLQTEIYMYQTQKRYCTVYIINSNKATEKMLWQSTQFC